MNYPGTDQRCPVETAIKVIGGKWKPLILFYLVDGTKRFNELRRLLPPISPQMLTRQLRELERDGIITRVVYAEVPARVEYALTPIGRGLRPVLEGVLQWGLLYLTERQGTP
jgi:DNA-binding HxlR family transcriptional regulator